MNESAVCCEPIQTDLQIKPRNLIHNCYYKIRFFFLFSSGYFKERLKRVVREFLHEKVKDVLFFV